MSKKNLIAGQSGGPTAAINSSLYGVVSEALKHTEEIVHVYGMVNGSEGFLNGTVLDFQEALPGEQLRPEVLPENQGSTSGRTASRSYLDTWRLSWLLPLQTSGISGRSGLSEAVPEIRGDEHRLVLLYRRK